MLRRFAIKDESYSPSDACAVLSYDEETDQYAIEIPEEVNPDRLTAIPGRLARKGIRSIGDRAGVVQRQMLHGRIRAGRDRRGGMMPGSFSSFRRGSEIPLTVSQSYISVSAESGFRFSTTKSML